MCPNGFTSGRAKLTATAGGVENESGREAVEAVLVGRRRVDARILADSRALCLAGVDLAWSAEVCLSPFRRSPELSRAVASLAMFAS